MEDEEKTKCKEVEVEEKGKKKRKHDDERDLDIQGKDEQVGNHQKKSVGSRQLIDTKKSESDHRVSNNNALENKGKTECKDGEQTEVAERSKKKRKKKERKVEDDDERDLYTRDIKDEQLGDSQDDNKNSESGHGNGNGIRKNKEETGCKDVAQIEVEVKSKKKRKYEDDDGERDACTQDEDRILCSEHKKTVSLKQLDVNETNESGHRVTNIAAMKEKKKIDCKDAEQIEVTEKSKKKKKSKSRVKDDDEDSCFRGGHGEGVSLKQTEVGKNSKFDYKATDSGAVKDVGQIEAGNKKKKRKSRVQEDDDKGSRCTRTEEGENSESGHRATITNSGSMKNEDETECKVPGQTEVAKKSKKKRMNQVQEGDDKVSCTRTEDGQNSEFDHRATNSGAMKNEEETECKNDEQTEEAERNKKKKKKRKSQVQEDGDDEKDSRARSRDESNGKVNSDDCAEDIEETKCKNDAKKKKKKRKGEERLNEVEGVLNDGGGHCTEDQEEPAKKIKKLKGRTGNKPTGNMLKKSKGNSDLPEEMDEAVDSQWQSAEFGNTSQKEKFLRLMGAYKTCNKERAAAASSYSVMAMNKQQENAFSFSLEKQFAQAMQTRKERGTGLGYK